MKKIITIMLLISIQLFAQDITNKLGGNDENAIYEIKNSDDDLLFQVDGNGDVFVDTDLYIGTDNSADNDYIYFDYNQNEYLRWNDTGGSTYFELSDELRVMGELKLDGALEDKDGDAGTSGQILSSTVTGTDWINSPTDVSVYTTNGQALSTGERAITTLAGGIGPSSLLFTIPTAAGNSGKAIELFIARADVNPGISFSESVSPANTNTTYSSNAYFLLGSIEEATITLVSDGTVWRGFGIHYGGDVCFIAGTKIDMADGSKKNIEDIEIGDLVASVDKNKNVVNKKVLKTFSNPKANGLVEIAFSDGTINVNTSDHRYYVDNKGWCAVEPNSVHTGEKLVVGYECLILFENELKIVEVSKITDKPGMLEKTYNFTVEETECYFANGILVHNRY